MNIRNVFLVSMIVCAAPVMAAAPTVSLAEQTENIVFEHMNKLYYLTPAMQKMGQTALQLRKTYLERILKEMRVGLSASDFKARLDEIDFVCESKEEDQLERFFESLKGIEKKLFGMLVLMEVKYGDLVDHIVRTGKTITKRDIDSVKKIIECTTKALKAHGSVKTKHNTQTLHIPEQTQKILLGCMIKLNKLLRPEVQQLVKKVILLRKKLAEHELHQLRKNGVSFWRYFLKPEWYGQGREEIEKLKEKLQLSKDEKNVMSALHFCKRQYIDIFIGQKPKKTDDLSRAIFYQEKEVKNLAFVLQAL